MMRADLLYPEGFHPDWHSMTPDISRQANARRRRDVGLVKYNFIDFGISTKFNETDTNRVVSGRKGLDQEVPELHMRDEYDAFALDVFILGNVYKKVLVSVRTGVKVHGKTSADINSEISKPMLSETPLRLDDVRRTRRPTNGRSGT